MFDGGTSLGTASVQNDPGEYRKQAKMLSELEPLSPEVTLRPEAEYLFPERWTLTRLDRDVTTHEDARAVAASIPPSPFAR